MSLEHTLRKRWKLVAALVAVAVIGVASAWAATGSKASHYVLAFARTGTVRQTISATATLQPVNEADLRFSVSGTVASVAVKVGQNVTAGTVLATLDTASLSAQLAQAQASLDAANEKLAADTAGPTPQELATASGAVTSAQNALNSAQRNLNDTEVVNQATLAPLEAGVRSAQSTLSSDEASQSADKAALATDQQEASRDCAASPSSSACASDQATVKQAENTLATASQSTSSAQSALQSAQSSLAVAQARAQQADDQAQAQVNAATSQLANAQASLQALRTSVPQAQLTADEASVAAATSQLAVAQHAINQASLISPISGAVAAVNISAGDTVSGNTGTGGSSSSGGSTGTSGSSSSGSSSSAGGSPAASIVVVSPGAFEADTSVSDTQIAQVKLGDLATITPDGSSRPDYGTVTQIGLLADQTSGVATYPVTIGITGTPTGLFAGAGAEVSIVVAQHAGVLTVPTGAVHTVGSRSFVFVLRSGKKTRVHVTVGATGSLLTEITSGLSPGDQVVLANLAASPPSASGPAGPGGKRFGGGGKRFGGGGAFGGGGKRFVGGG